jgi:hypothetical protein
MAARKGKAYRKGMGYRDWCEFGLVVVYGAVQRHARGKMPRKAWEICIWVSGYRSSTVA